MKLTMPEPIRGWPAGTWANDTVVRRLPAIAQRVVAENTFPPDVVTALNALSRDIPEALITFLPDTVDWHAYIAPYTTQNWLQVPWFFAETYFYRRVLAATGYFVVGETKGMDPFAYQKQRGLAASAALIAALCQRLADWATEAIPHEAALYQLLAVDLWGNRADLSLWPADEGQAEVQLSEAQMLVDDRMAVIHHLLAHAPARVDIIADNAGFELVCDLVWADYLLHYDLAERVTFHLKMHPTFVSDAMITDVEETITVLMAAKDAATVALGQRLQTSVANGRLHLTQHPFWTSPLAMWALPDDLRQQLGKAHLIMSKGDANYRRLLGDRLWPFTTPFAEIVNYMPTATVALRTYKAEVGAGLTVAQMAWLDAEEPEWRVNGRWGVVQWTNNG